MNEFTKTLLSLTLSGTLLFLFVLFLNRLCRERFSRRWQYYIWLVVVLRFLLPFAPGFTFSSYLFDRIETVRTRRIRHSKRLRPIPASRSQPLPGHLLRLSHTRRWLPWPGACP